MSREQLLRNVLLSAVTASNEELLNYLLDRKETISTDELEYYAGNTILKHPLIEESRNLIKTI